MREVAVGGSSSGGIRSDERGSSERKKTILVCRLLWQGRICENFRAISEVTGAGAGIQ